MSDTDTEEWKQQLADGKISQEDFDDLMKSEQSLSEMNDIIKKGDKS